MKKLSALVLATTASTALFLGATTAAAQEVEDTHNVTVATTETAADNAEVAEDAAEPAVVDAPEAADLADEESESSWKDKLAVAWKVIKWAGFGVAIITGGIPGAMAYAPVLGIG